MSDGKMWTLGSVRYFKGWLCVAVTKYIFIVSPGSFIMQRPCCVYVCVKKMICVEYDMSRKRDLCRETKWGDDKRTTRTFSSYCERIWTLNITRMPFVCTCCVCVCSVQERQLQYKGWFLSLTNWCFPEWEVLPAWLSAHCHVLHWNVSLPLCLSSLY